MSQVTASMACGWGVGILLIDQMCVLNTDAMLLWKGIALLLNFFLFSPQILDSQKVMYMLLLISQLIKPFRVPLISE